MSKHTFEGFSPKTIEFLYELRANNTKSWFEENRQDYEEYLLGPTRELVKSLSDTALEIDPAVDTRPLVSRTISRIYRDTRFSNNKLPYRARMWIVFRQLREDTADYPSFYFEIDPEYYCFGMGMYRAEKVSMDKLRNFILEKPDAFRRATAFSNEPDNKLLLQGEAYKRMDISKVPEDLKEWYRKKNFYVECMRPIDRTLFTEKLAEDIRNAYTTLAPFYTMLCRIHDDLPVG